MLACLLNLVRNTRRNDGWRLEKDAEREREIFDTDKDGMKEMDKCLICLGVAKS